MQHVNHPQNRTARKSKGIHGQQQRILLGVPAEKPRSATISEPSGSRGTQNAPLAQVLTEGPHSPDSLTTENTFGCDNTRYPLWGVSNYTHTNTGVRSRNITVLPKTPQKQNCIKTPHKARQ